MHEKLREEQRDMVEIKNIIWNLFHSWRNKTKQQIKLNIIDYIWLCIPDQFVVNVDLPEAIQSRNTVYYPSWTRTSD